MELVPWMVTQICEPPESRMEWQLLAWFNTRLTFLTIGAVQKWNAAGRFRVLWGRGCPALCVHRCCKCYKSFSEGKSLESQSQVLWLSLDLSQLACTVLHYWAPVSLLGPAHAGLPGLRLCQDRLSSSVRLFPGCPYTEDSLNLQLWLRIDAVLHEHLLDKNSSFCVISEFTESYLYLFRPVLSQVPVSCTLKKGFLYLTALVISDFGVGELK